MTAVMGFFVLDAGLGFLFEVLFRPLPLGAVCRGLCGVIFDQASEALISRPCPVWHQFCGGSPFNLGRGPCTMFCLA